jgi:hypothetical protein
MESAPAVFDSNSNQVAKIYELIANNPSNNRCADCDQMNPEWTSLGFGIFICLSCAGYHRSMGAHITSVRSLTLDDWSPEQYEILEHGGNDRFWEYLKNFRSVQKYHLPEVLYYTEVLKARLQNREAKEYNPVEWTGLVKSADSASNPSSAKFSQPSVDGSVGSTPTTPTNSSRKSMKSIPVPWMSDTEAKQCSLCSSQFSFINRKHHCRRCGKVVCGECAPVNNTRPIMEWGMNEPVRHCKSCYKSPSVQWKS